MSDDFISSISQKKHNEKNEANVFFPDIPEPPPGFDPEAHILYKNNVEPPTKISKAKKKTKLIPRAKVFIIGNDGNPEYEEILLKGIEGKVVLGRKEISDLRGSDKYKVFLEWMEVTAKK